MLRLLNDANCAADAKSRTVLLQLDLSASFDTVDKITLVDRLEKTIWNIQHNTSVDKFIFAIRLFEWEMDVPPVYKMLVRDTARIRAGSPPIFAVGYVASIADVIQKFFVSHAQYADDTQLNVGLSLSDHADSVVAV